MFILWLDTLSFDLKNTQLQTSNSTIKHVTSPSKNKIFALYDIIAFAIGMQVGTQWCFMGKLNN